jgi:hypothetical protein
VSKAIAGAGRGSCRERWWAGQRSETGSPSRVSFSGERWSDEFSLVGEWDFSLSFKDMLHGNDD